MAFVLVIFRTTTMALEKNDKGRSTQVHRKHLSTRVTHQKCIFMHKAQKCYIASIRYYPNKRANKRKENACIHYFICFKCL